MIERYYRELLSHFSRRTRSAENAADIVQEAYSRVIAVQQSGSAIAEPRAPVSYTHLTLPTKA